MEQSITTYFLEIGAKCFGSAMPNFREWRFLFGLTDMFCLRERTDNERTQSHRASDKLNLCQFSV